MGRIKEFVGSITSMWLCRYAGSDHSGALISHAPLSSCSKTEYSVLSNLFGG